MKMHPAASIFPLLEGDAFDAFVADIKKNGQQEPIYKLDGQIIDGRNRLRACKKLRLEPWIEDVEDVEDPFVFVMSMNYHRRHLTMLQKGQALQSMMKHNGATRQAAQE